MSSDHQAGPRRVFLTGATGFLGSFLLRELLRQTRAVVSCLVRARDEEEGSRRLEQTLRRHLLWEEGFRGRVVAVSGDLARPHLGLAPERWRDLAREAEAIFHAGALVNFVHPYPALKAPNVRGTEEVLRLAAQDRLKPVHHISTLSVFATLPRAPRVLIREDDAPAPPDPTRDSVNGYQQSKWVAEQLVGIARARGIPVSVYRPGRVTGDSRSGVCNLDDYATLYVKGCVQLGLIPAIDVGLSLIPVDYCAAAVARLSALAPAPGRNYHLVNPLAVGLQEVAGWIRDFGYPVEQVPYADWRAALERSPENALHPLLPVIPPPDDARQVALHEEFPEGRIVEVDSRNTTEALAGTGLSCPPPDGRLVHTYLSYLVRINYLDAPRGAGVGAAAPVTTGPAAA